MIGVDQELPMPKLVIAINAINKPRDKVSSYMINYSLEYVSKAMKPLKLNTQGITQIFNDLT